MGKDWLCFIRYIQLKSYKEQYSSKELTKISKWRTRKSFSLQTGAKECLSKQPTKTFQKKKKTHTAGNLCIYVFKHIFKYLST